MDIIPYLRQFRIGGFAVFDFTISYIGIWFLAPLLSKLARRAGAEIPRVNWLYFTLPISVLTHVAVGSFTPLTKSFIDPSSGYVVKGIVVLSFLLGLRGITRVRKTVHRR